MTETNRPKAWVTLGTSSTAVTSTSPQLRAERNVVPMPKHMTSMVFGGPWWKASGRWAMNLVMGVKMVMPKPLTSSILSDRWPPKEMTEAR